MGKNQSHRSFKNNFKLIGHTVFIGINLVCAKKDTVKEASL